MPSEEGLITLREIQEARRNVETSDLGVIKTPLMQHVQGMFPQLPASVDLYLKLENTQTTGSFKIRGVANQMKFLPEEVKNGERKLITMSAGNYGKAFAYALQKINLSGLCLMPITAPQERVALIKEYGTKVEQVPTAELETRVSQYIKEQNYIYLHSFDDFNLITGYGSMGCRVETCFRSDIGVTIKHYEHTCGFHVLHSFDDTNLIAGHASAALEVLDDGVRPDIVLVCCGGGGLVSGIAAAIKLSGLTDCRVYAVEPRGSPTMHESFKKGSPVTMPVKSVAGGLSPPYAGTYTFQHCKKFIEGVILVSDEELVNCMHQFYQRGLVVEPSGCAAMAALLGGHVPGDIAGKKVLVFVTGGNITPPEINALRH